MVVINAVIIILSHFVIALLRNMRFTVGTFVTLMSVGVTAMMMASVSGAADMYPNTVGVTAEGHAADRFPPCQRLP